MNHTNLKIAAASPLFLILFLAVTTLIAVGVTAFVIEKLCGLLLQSIAIDARRITAWVER